MMATMQRVCVFCGSSPGGRPEYVQAARLLGQTLAQQGLALVYGGARVGLMGAVAQACLDAGGEVIGVLPRKLAELDLAHAQLTRLHVVETMHERKALMAELADGFIALPGGLGTIEEISEVLTWAQLGMHAKPCGLLNTCGFYDRFLAFLDVSVDQQFVQPPHRLMIQVDAAPAGLLRKFAGYQAPASTKVAWIRQMSDPAQNM